MPKITVINADKIQSELTYEAGQNLMELLRDADFDEIAALCGGNCSCATCHVHLDPQQFDATQFDPPNEIELELLDLADDYIPQISRLSCQLTLEDRHDGMHVKLLGMGW